MKITYKDITLFEGIIGTTHIYSKPLYDMIISVINTLNDKYPNVILNKEDAFVDDLYDCIVAYMDTLSYDEYEVSATFTKIIKESSPKFEQLRFDKNPLMKDIFEKFNTNISNDFYKE